MPITLMITGDTPDEFKTSFLDAYGVMLPGDMLRDGALRAIPNSNGETASADVVQPSPETDPVVVSRGEGSTPSSPGVLSPTPENKQADPAPGEKAAKLEDLQKALVDVVTTYTANGWSKVHARQTVMKLLEEFGASNAAGVPENLRAAAIVGAKTLASQVQPYAPPNSDG